MRADVTVDGRRLKIRRLGRLAGWCGPPVDVSLDHVVSVEVADPRAARRWNLGFRLAGIQIPGYLVSGLFMKGGERTWWHVGRGLTAMAITLRDEQLARVIVDVADPAALKASIQRPLPASEKLPG